MSEEVGRPRLWGGREESESKVARQKGRARVARGWGRTLLQRPWPLQPFGQSAVAMPNTAMEMRAEYWARIIIGDRTIERESDPL